MNATARKFLDTHITVKEAAERLGRSVQRVRCWIHGGYLPSLRVGHLLLVPAKALEGFAPPLSGAANPKYDREKMSAERRVTATRDAVKLARARRQAAARRKAETAG